MQASNIDKLKSKPKIVQDEVIEKVSKEKRRVKQKTKMNEQGRNKKSNFEEETQKLKNGYGNPLDLKDGPKDTIPQMNGAESRNIVEMKN